MITLKHKKGLSSFKLSTRKTFIFYFLLNLLYYYQKILIHFLGVRNELSNILLF